MLAGSEVNIAPDGSLDYDDDVLAELDWVVASVHSSFQMDAKTMTERIVRAIENPLVDVIGHLTGRKIERRPPYELDFEAVLDAAARSHTMLEINSSPARRDLDDPHARAAAQAGVGIVINCDAHRTGGFEVVRYGIATARRAWLGPEAVLNTRPGRSCRRDAREPSRADVATDPSRAVTGAPGGRPSVTNARTALRQLDGHAPPGRWPPADPGGAGSRWSSSRSSARRA